MTGILGSGFGLYGYLPAVVRSGEKKILLLSKAKEVFLRRPELQFCKDHIEWAGNVDELIRRSDRIIFAVTPSAQLRYIKENAGKKKFDRVILEKPIAPTPDEAASILSMLAGNNIPTRIGFTFLFTNWAKETRQQLGPATPADTFRLTWNFLAHHYKNNSTNWKRFHQYGGGALRFYGIQVLAFLSGCGYTEVVTSSCEGYTADDIYHWTAVFKGTGLPAFDISLNCNSTDTQFTITSSIKGSRGSHLKEPFDDGQPGLADKRLGTLSSVLASFETETDDDALTRYRKVNELWRQAEEKNVITTKEIPDL